MAKVALKGKQYHTVVVCDYDRAVAVQEMEDMLDSAHGSIKRRDIKVITTGDAQASIEAKVALMNAEGK